MFGPVVWRFGRLTDPYAELSRLRSDINKLFSGATHSFTQAYPAVNIWVDEQEAIVTAELAGIDPEKLDISVQGDNLNLSGSREPETLQETETYHRKERNGSRFARTLQLPFRIDANGIDARYEKGILKITVPRAAEDKARKISIKAA
jgi:HSP20 family protein